MARDVKKIRTTEVGSIAAKGTWLVKAGVADGRTAAGAVGRRLDRSSRFVLPQQFALLGRGFGARNLSPAAGDDDLRRRRRDRFSPSLRSKNAFR